VFTVSCLSWNRRGRSSVKIAERTHAKRAKVPYRRREGCHFEAHLLDKVPVSDLCDELGLQPTVFYRWQKEFFENGAAAFQGKSRPGSPKPDSNGSSSCKRRPRAKTRCWRN